MGNNNSQRQYLSRTKVAVINLLATGYSVDDVASVLGVDLLTIYEWSRCDELFRQELAAVPIQQMTRQNTLTPLQEAVIDLLVSGLSTKQAAEKLGIKPQRVYNWEHRNPEFRNELKRRRRQRSPRVE